MSHALRAGLVFLVAGVCAGGCADDQTSAVDPSATVTPTAVPGSIPDVVSRLEPSVVTVYPSSGLGSGVVYRSEGVIVTNAHVVGQQRRVTVTFADGSDSAGEVVGADAVSDLAVIRTERGGLPAARFASELPRPGETVLAIGSPLGFENSVTQGIISGLGRQLPAATGSSYPSVDLMQTDAAISPGNSGGALVNARGEVVGLNEAYIPPQAGAVSLGFAIPAATVIDSAEQLLTKGRVDHAYLGVSVTQLTADLASALGLAGDNGVLIRQIAEGGPAAGAGLRAGDVMVAFGGTPTPTVLDFFSALRAADPGDRVRLEIRRRGDSRAVEVVLGRLGGG
jgi:S1-C subfamily serine protease